MEKLTIFYDGKCHLCYQEIKHYIKLDKGRLLVPIDITSSEFSAQNYGLDNDEVNLHMHVQTEDGANHIGVDAFIEIWKRVKPYNHLTFVLDNPIFKPAWKLGYKVFAHYIRPNLPKRNCEEGTCGITRPNA